MSFIKNIGLKLAGINKKQYGMLSTSGLSTAKWSTRDYENFAKEAYIINFISYRCIDFTAQSVGSVPWSVFKLKMDETGKEKREELTDHPVRRILHRANPKCSFSMFNYANIAYLTLSGNNYIEKIGPESGINKGVPKELYYYQPDKIKFKVDDNTGELFGYQYVVNGKVKKDWEIDPITQYCDLLHIKTFHPINELEGLSKVEPAAKSIDTSNEAMTWNKSLLQNQGRPGMLFNFETILGDQQYEKLQNQINAKFGGPDNVGRNLIIEGNLKDVKPYGFSPTEMDFLKGNWDLARQICLIWGVPPQLLGIPGDSTFANFEQAQEFWWENSVFWYLQLYKDEYNNWLFPGSDEIFIDYILDDVLALEYQRKQKWEKVKEANFLTINEKREEVGYGTIEGGDVILVPSTQVPLDMMGVSEEEVDDSEEDITEDDSIDEEMQAELLNLKGCY